MNKVKCENGHFFDRDKFQSCPICGADKINITASVASVDDDSGMKRIQRTMPLLSKTEMDNPPVQAPESEKKKIDELAPTEMMQSEDAIIPQPEVGVVAVASGAFLPTEKQFPEETKPHSGKSRSITKTAAEKSSDTASAMGEPTPLQMAVMATGSQRISPLPKTVAYYSFDEAEPPVGWLVCIKGVYFGRSFECKAGKNLIGKNPDMDICLDGDTSITREIHAVVIFEPRQRHFFIQAGTGKGLVYHNGEILFDHAELLAYDKITLGKTDFVFLPLCGKQFSWDDYISEV